MKKLCIFANDPLINYYEKGEIKDGYFNPQNFFELLKENNINTKKTFSYPDHYNFSKEEIDNFMSEAKKNGYQIN